MQRFQFGLRQSAESVDDSRSRYVPSSVYSAGGPGPAEDSPALDQTRSFMSGGLRGPFEEQTPRFTPVSTTCSRLFALELIMNSQLSHPKKDFGIPLFSTSMIR